MKHKLSLFAVLLMALAIPQSVMANDFSAVSPSGHTLYYNINDSTVAVTYPGAQFELAYSGFEKPVGNLVIPSNVIYNGMSYPVTSIVSYAFASCSDLTSVTIPGSIISIGTSAFMNCTGLTSVSIPSSVTSIGNYVFSGCSGLSSIVVESGNAYYDSRDNCNAIIKTAYNELLVGCKNTIIPNTVTQIQGDAFAGCTGLTAITIPSSVIGIGLNAFMGCTGLASIVVESGNTAFDSRNDCNAIIYTSLNMLVEGCKNTSIPNSVTSIHMYAFSNRTSINSLSIPNSVTEIGYGAFNRVRHIEYYGTATGGPWGAWSMNGVTEGEFVFSNNTKDTLTAYIGSGGNVTIPNTVTCIGAGCFSGCSSLTSVSIPNTVTSIGTNAFHECTNIATINSAAIVPPTAANGCFYSISSLIPVYVPCESVTTYQSAAEWKKFTNIQCNGNSGIEDVGEDVANIFQQNGQIVVDNTNNEEVVLYDINGRKLSRKHDKNMPLFFNISTGGIYLVKIGNHPARKVVVLR